MTPIPPDKLDEAWFWIRKGLEQVARKTNVDWSPADVYLAAKAGKASIYTLGQDDGFVVVQMHQDQRGPYLFVWAIYGSLAHIKHEIMDSLRKLAVSVGARRMEMRSVRGWDKAGLGWRVRDVIYEADIFKE